MKQEILDLEFQNNFMQRQIKFRFWDLKNNTWVKQMGLYDDGLIGDFSECFHNIAGKNGEYFVAQQFTGLIDKNGRDVYEGDIVKTDPDHFVAKLRARRESEEYTEYTKGQVRWVNEGFMVCQEYIGATRISEYSVCDCCPCGLEIIGNIFKNKELLS